MQSEEDSDIMLSTAKKANIIIVSLPLVNPWLQNRCEFGSKTPKRRGISLLKEIDRYEVVVCLASDNTRDQFYAYGNLDMLKVFKFSSLLAHLDRPSLGNWPKAVTETPARAMGLDDTYGVIKVGGKPNLVLFRSRYYSELFSRPQNDRVCLREGKHINVSVPLYEELDEVMGKYALSNEQPPKNGCLTNG